MARPWSFSPLVLRPALWLDASDASTLWDSTVGGSLVAADGTIARWEDKSGNGRHATQGTGVSQPLRKTGIKNGRDVVRFDGANDRLSSTIVDSSATEYAVFMVMYRNGGSTVVAFSNGGTGSDGYALYQNGATRALLHGGVSDLSDSSWPDTTWELWCGQRTGGTASLYINGSSVSITNSTASVNAPTGNTWIGDGGGGNYFPGDIAEIIVYPSALDASARQAVEAYLNQKWAIY